jgi:hypothetical protein
MFELAPIPVVLLEDHFQVMVRVFGNLSHFFDSKRRISSAFSGVFSLIGITLVGTGAAAAAAQGSFVGMVSRPSFVVCCDNAYAPLLDAVLMRVRVKRNAESQSSMQDVSWPVGLPSNNSLGMSTYFASHDGQDLSAKGE